ncbi:MAG: toll/interleukin-1 receptor domain-containing protein [Chthoniobacterales bacterium]
MPVFQATDTKTGLRAAMAHDVFISHSTRDKPVSDAVCAALENSGIRCWVAPRDVQPGRSFAGEITRAIQQSKAMVLIFSANSNNSSQVLREVQLAVDSQLHILQFRIEEVLLNDDLKYYLSTPHWLDAMTPPLESHLDRLATSINALLGKPLATPERKSGGPAAPKGEERALPIQSVAPAKSPSRNLWRAALAGGVVLCGIVFGMILWRDRTGPQPAAALPPVATATASPAASVIASFPPTQAFPIPSEKKKKLFSHNFETASPIVRPLFGPNVMSVQNANGEGQITAKSAGILPAMFDELSLDDFIVECGMRAENAPAGARYGFIFRAADVKNGGIAKYYALLLDPNQNVAQVSWWMEGKWMMNPEQPVPAGLLKVGRKSRVTLEAIGNQFRVFINDRFATEFSMGGLTIGRLGLCLSAADATPWTVHFDNLQVYLPPTKETAKPFQRSWDFSAGMLADIRTEGVEVVDASIWKMAGGKHLRFLTGGRSFLETAFEVPDGSQTPTRLTTRHLSSSPDGIQPGYSPVRITLNGNEVFRGSPAKSGWMEDEIDLGNYAQPGHNTLRWDYLDGAQTHYWLKSFRISSSQP